MNNWKLLCGVSAIATMMAPAAYADVTAQQVWGDMKSYLQGFGYDVISTEATSGDTLRISDLKMSMVLPEDEGDMAINIAEISFTNTGDGTVSVSFPNVMPILVNVRPKDDKSADVALDYTQTGFSMVVSGDASEMLYSYTAADLGLALKSLTVDGTPVDIGAITMNMTNVIGNTKMAIGTLRDIDQTMQVDTLTYNFDIKDPEGDGAFLMTGALNEMTMQSDGSFPTGIDSQDVTAMFKAGFAFDGAFGHKGGQSQLSFTEDGIKTDAASRSDSGSFTVAMDAEKLTYSAAANGMAVDLSGGEIPFPIALQMAESKFNMVMPLAKSDEEQDFALAVNLGGFTMSDMIWGIFDPTAQLPRDPATVAFDLSGKAKLFLDLMDPEQMKKVDEGEEMPGELNALTLNSVLVSAAGAKLTGAGDFTFDNTDLTSFDGMPAPEGAVDLQLVGGNGLLDKLIAMGLVPEDQAMGTRMMMGLFAVPGDAPDTLNSKIEVNDQGHVLANGQRLK